MVITRNIPKAIFLQFFLWSVLSFSTCQSFFCPTINHHYNHHLHHHNCRSSSPSFLIQQQQRQPARKRVSTASSSTSLAVSSSTPTSSSSTSPTSSSSDNNENPPIPPVVEFIDPQTQCHVVLLGCFHGTESSSKDVQQVITPDTDIVVLELCDTRYQDMIQGMEKERKEQQAEAETTSFAIASVNDNNNNKKSKQSKSSKSLPWWIAYLSMIKTTTQQRGMATGVAAAVLGLINGMQTALSGFSPGLEFRTAVEYAERYQCDIVLADRDVDETLRRIGRLPFISWEMLTNTAKTNNNNNNNNNNPIQEYMIHSKSLQRAIFGPSSSSSSTSSSSISLNNMDAPNKDKTTSSSSSATTSTSTTSSSQLFHPIHLGQALIRSAESVQDLIRLTIPPTLLYYCFIQILLSFSPIVTAASAATTTTTAAAATTTSTMADTMDPTSMVVMATTAITTASIDNMSSISGISNSSSSSSSSLSTLLEIIPHWIASLIILSMGYLGIALPSVKVILTERDVYLAEGIQEACRQAGKDGRVVAVLGMLHVNGVAARMLSQPEHDISTTSSTL